MIPRAITLALAQLGDPRFRNVLLKGIGLTLALLIAIYAAVFFAVGWLVGDGISLPLVGRITWVDDLLSWASLLLMMGLSVFLMIPVAAAFVSMFLDEVAEAVEERHYPDLPKVKGVPFLDGVMDGLGMLATVILANIVALVLGLVLGLIYPLIFLGVNGFLLGREYYTLAAIRRRGRAEARTLRRRNLGRIWTLGALMAVPLVVPVLNLVVPILGAAAYTHLFHMLEGREPGAA